MRLPPQVGAREPLTRFVIAALFGLACVVGLAMQAFTGTTAVSILAAAAAYSVGAAIAGIALHRSYPHAALGGCNIVTLVRLVLAASLVAALFSTSENHWPILAIAAAALSLDGVDGWLARREGLVSAFGARFDMEVDSALALVLAVNAWSAGHAGALVLLLGLPRYLFIAAGGLLPWLSGDLPDRQGRKVVCVIQLAALIALQAPVVADIASGPLVMTVAAALTWSFGRDIVWLWRERA